MARKPSKKILTPEEMAIRVEESLKYDLEDLRKHSHVPSPTYFFAVGERVIYGAHPNAEVVEVYDDGKFYKIKTWGDYKVYTQIVYQEDVRIVDWLQIDYYRTPEENAEIPVLREKDDLQLSYYQSDLSGLLHMYYHAGIDMSPDYQRGNVWTMEDKVALIDSVFRNVDIGKIVTIKTEKLDCYYEMLDGKQRLTALLEFYENRFTYKGYYFQDLSWTDQNHFTGHPVSRGELSRTVTKKQRYKYFLRLNTSGHAVSKEHLAYVQKLYDECEE